MIEKTEFFECCDKYGIMVWQEFPHGCSNSPKDPDYLAYSEIEGEAILRKIRNHVCLSLICGGNEVLYYGEMFLLVCSVSEVSSTFFSSSIMIPPYFLKYSFNALIKYSSAANALS